MQLNLHEVKLLLSKLASLHPMQTQIDKLCENGYFLNNNFLEPEIFQDLRLYVLDLEQHGKLRHAKIGQTQSIQLNEAIRSDAISWLEEESSSPAVQAFLKKISELAQLLNQELFLNLNEFETHFAVYQPGAFYKKHVDQFAHNKDRKISFVYYLNSEWQDEYGGHLALYDSADQCIEKITPHANRLICFKSDIPHEVCVTQQTRYSIAGWLKSCGTKFQ